MARVITESWEGNHFYRVGNDIPNTTPATIVTTPILDPNGARVLQMQNSTLFIPLRYNGSGPPISRTEIFVGFFLRHESPFSNSSNVSGSDTDEKHRLISFWDGATPICTIRIDPDTQNLCFVTGGRYFFDAGSGFVGSAPIPPLAFSTQGQPITADTLYHIQVRVVVNGATSVVQVKLDDVLVIDWAGTLPGATITRFAIQGSGARFSDTDGNVYYDDIVVNDTLAATCAVDQTWPGILLFKVQVVSGPGTYAQFTPNPAVPNYQNVDDLPHDGDTTHNYALSSGLKDSFPVSPHGLAASQVTFRAWFQEVIARKTSGTMQIKLGVRRAGTDYIMANGIDVGVSYDVFDSRLCTDPSSLVAWTDAGLDSTEIIYQSN